jgi:hypothetical protein
MKLVPKFSKMLAIVGTLVGVVCIIFVTILIILFLIIKHKEHEQLRFKKCQILSKKCLMEHQQIDCIFIKVLAPT